MYIFRTQDVILKSADVAALKPLINLENGLTAMRWFMERHACIPFGLQKINVSRLAYARTVSTGKQPRRV